LTPFYKNIALWLVICLMVVMLFQMFKQPERAGAGLSYSEFLSMVDTRNVSK